VIVHRYDDDKKRREVLIRGTETAKESSKQGYFATVMRANAILGVESSRLLKYHVDCQRVRVAKDTNNDK